MLYCLLHATARIVEKLLNMEINTIMGEGNTYHQTNVNMTKEDLIRNLQANINMTDIRQGHFVIHCDKSGKPEPVKLNKDAALAILSPPPPGMESKFPHVLNNVLFESLFKRKADEKFSAAVSKYLNLPTDMAIFPLVSTMWDSMFRISILRTEPQPKLIEGLPEGSLFPSDYTWGLHQQKNLNINFKLNVFTICFVHVMHRASWPHICANSSIMLRSSWETYQYFWYVSKPEQENIQTTCMAISFIHTLPGMGAKGSVMPLCLCWRQHEGVFAMKLKRVTLMHTISQNSFQSTELRWQSSGCVKVFWCAVASNKLALSPSTECWRLWNKSVKVHLHEETLSSCTTSLSFENLHFIWVGNIPKYNNKKCTRANIANRIACNGWKIRNSLPVKTKEHSRKKYPVLYNHTNKSTTLASIRESVRMAYPPMTYDFIHDSVLAKHRL